MDNQLFLSLVEKSFDDLADSNRVLLPSEGKEVTVLERPLVGFAAADDPLFERFSEEAVIGPDWKSPREWMPEGETVVGFFFPFTEDILLRARAETALTGEAWNTGYSACFPLVDAFLDRLVSLLASENTAVFQPNRDPSLKRTMTEILSGGEADIHFSVGWSNRHVCYAAGLGTFGIHRHLITEKGCAGTLASFITDAKLIATPRNYEGVYDYCIECMACARRCPAGAITRENLRNLKKCSALSARIREEFGSGFCGKCLYGGTCSNKNPSAVRSV